MAKFNVGDKVYVSSKYSIFTGKMGEVQSVFSSSEQSTIACAILIDGVQRFFHEDNLTKLEEPLTLRDRAKQGLDLLKEAPVLNFDEKLNLAGWFNGEWTCACCGTMIGKNLKGESPFALVRIHVNECTRK